VFRKILLFTIFGAIFRPSGFFSQPVGTTVKIYSQPVGTTADFLFQERSPRTQIESPSGIKNRCWEDRKSCLEDQENGSLKRQEMVL
jgi:hypothetical protein